MADDDVKQCQGCGASIYQEHLDRGLARFVSGRLLCPACTGAAPPKKGAAGAKKKGGAAAGEGSGDMPTISLVDEGEPGGSSGGSGTGVPAASSAPPKRKPRESPSASVAAGLSQFGGVPIADDQFQRPLTKGSYATRCRTFHGKLTEGSLVYMNDQINEWVDNNGDIEIKFVTSCIGVFEGKHSEPHLFLTVFY